MKKFITNLSLFILFMFGVNNMIHAQLPNGIVPYHGIPILVPQTLSGFNTMNYCRITSGAWIPRDTTVANGWRPITIPSGHATVSNASSIPNALHILSAPTLDHNTCWNYNNSDIYKLSTFPNQIEFSDWDTASYGIPRVLRMGNTTPLEGTVSGNTGMTASYYFIPTEEENLLVFWLTFVATNPLDASHRRWRNPLFRVEFTDLYGNFLTTNPMHSSFYVLPKGADAENHPYTFPLVDGQTQYTCNAPSSNPSFDDGVFWCSWFRIAVDLSAYEGDTIRLRTLVSECSANYHRAYCYFTGFGTRSAINVQACGDDMVYLRAPNGFEDYKWFINGILQPNLNGREITRIRNTTEVSFECQFTSIIGATISQYATINYYDLYPSFTWEQKFDNCNNKVQFTNTSEIYKINNGGNVSQTIQYVLWDYGDGITSTEINPTHIYAGTGPYDVRLTIWDADSICNLDTIMTITLAPSENTYGTDEVSTCEEKLPFVYTDPLMSPNDNYTWSAEGTYTVTYPFAAWNGCDSIVRVTLSIDKPQVRIEQLQDYCDVFSTELVAIPNNPNVNYLWSTEETQESIIVTKHGTYSVTITDENECTAKASIKILACEPPVFIPSAITPSDKNTLNDCIRIHSSNLISSIDFTIFDRFGGIVYRTFNKEFVWCGEVRGEVPLNVIYQYVLIYVDDKGIERIKKGTITVL